MYVSYTEVCQIKEVLKEHGDDNLIKCFEYILKDYDKVINERNDNHENFNDGLLLTKIKNGYHVTIKEIRSDDKESFKISY